MRTGPRPWVVFGLEGLQRLPGLHRSAVGIADRFLNAVFSYQPQLAGAVSADPSGPPPEILSALPADIPVLDSGGDGPDVPEGMAAVFHVLCLLGDDPVTALWPAWARHSDVGLVTTVHDITSERQLESPPSGPVHSLRRSRYRLAEEADAVIATSHASANYVSGAFETEPGQIFVVPDGARPASARVGTRDLVGHNSGRHPGTANMPFILAFCEQLGAQSTEVLVDAFCDAEAELSEPFALRIVTTSSRPPKDAVAETLGRTTAGGRHIAWAGDARDVDMPDLLSACRGVVVHCLDTTLAWAAIEAMQAGAVTVVPDAGVFREMVPQPAARFNPASVDDTAAALMRVVADDHFRRYRIEDAASTAKAYSWENTLSAARRAYTVAATRRPVAARRADR